MAINYLDLNGMKYLVAKLKALLSNKSDKDHTHNPLDVGGLPHVAGVSSDGVAFTATCEEIKELTAGTAIIFIPNMTTTTETPTLNVNSLGAVTIRRKLSSGTATLTAGGLTTFFWKNRPVLLVYDTATANGTPYWIAMEFTKTDANDIYGSIPVKSGGTGLSSLTAGEVLVGNGTEDVTTKAIDTTPTSGSTNLITSGAVYAAIPSTTEVLNFTYEDGNTRTLEVYVK